MKRLLLATAILAIAVSPGMAQEEKEFFFGELKFSLVQTDSDTISSKFEEYRDLSEGPRMSFARLYGKKGDFWYDLTGRNFGLEDQRYRLSLDNGTLSLKGNYYKVPHNFGNGGKTLLTQTGPGSFELSDTTQQVYQDFMETAPARNYGTTLVLVAPGLAAANLVDLKLSRERGNLVFAVTPEDSPIGVEATYARERRTGSRAASGTAFGFNNVVETPEPLHYLTQDFGIRADLDGKWGVATVAVRYNTFANRIDTQLWDNPFRATDSTSSNAYLGPYSTPDGPSQGLMALPPDNEALTGTVGATFKLGDRTRLSADVSLGDWTQNETPFIPFTTNTAIDTPALPANQLDGKIKTNAINAFLTSRLTDDLRLNVRYRRYDLNNDTPQLRFEHGYVRFDSVWEEIPRITVPNDYAKDRLEALLDYQVGDVTLEGGYRYAKTKRTWREADETTDNGFLAKIDYHGTDWLSLRVNWEFFNRDHDEAHYDIEHAEHYSFLDAGDATNQSILRRPDTAKKDQNRFGAQVQIAPPSGKVIFVASYFKSQDEFDESPVLNHVTGQMEAPLGLMSADFDTFTAEINVMPTDRTDLYAFYTRETFEDLQTGRQSGGTPSTNAADNWSSNATTDVDTFGFGGDFTLVPEKWDLGLYGRWQKADGMNAFGSGGSFQYEDIAAYDDTELLTIGAKLGYRLAEAWSVIIGGFYEDYSVDDAQTNGILNYMPGSFFLAANDGDYKATVGYVSVKYRW